MDILYMGYFCNEDLFNVLVENGSKSSHARQQFERKLLSGLMQNMQNFKFQSISYLPLVNEELSTLKGEIYEGYYITYLWSAKRIIDILKAIKANINHIKQWMADRGDDKIILTYSANPLHCIPALLLRKKYGYKIVTISSEISIYRRTTKSLLTWLKTKISYFLENNFDGYILLSKYMGEVVNCGNKPYIVMEGFGEIKDINVDSVSNRKKSVMYAGGLSDDNGIKILVEGFKRFSNIEWELWICGEGKLEEYVKEQSGIDARIKYFGVIPNEEVLKKEREASFLINPRFSGEDYTRYSFPSKTLEYISTGTPTIITRLKGIPEEYFENVIVLEDESADGVKNLFERIEVKPYEEFMELAKRAVCFVAENKTPSVQGKKIVEFLCNFKN